MKHLLSLSFLLLTTCANAQNYAVISYNIRYDNGHDGPDDWALRKKGVADILLNNNANIIGLQEVLNNQLLYLDSALTGYKHIGVGRDDGKTKGEYSPIYYRTDKFTLIDSGGFWLSETPNKCSKGWDAACKRICTWVILRDTLTKKEVYVFNTHFDHKGKTAQKESALLLYNKIESAKKRGYPVIVTGDFNSLPQSEAIGTLLGNSLTVDSYAKSANKPLGTIGTSNSFELNGSYTGRIDYVLITPDIRVDSYKVINDTLANGRWPSDHFPVLVKLNLK